MKDVRFHNQKVNCLLAMLFFLITDVAYNQNEIDPLLSLQDAEANDQDDMCIWVHPNPSLSTVIASDKYAYKLFVYDLNGNTIQTISVPGSPGNIDVRYNFPLLGQLVDIVGYNDRDSDEIVIYKVNHSDRTLVHVANFDAMNKVYGFCFYRNLNNGKYYAIASNTSSQMRQWELIDTGNGTIDGIEKRTWYNGSGYETEGLVADDEGAELYAANEEHGIYKYDADPDDPNPVGQLIAPTGSNGLVPDVEGITLYYAANGEGYLIASSQGSEDFKVYERMEPHNFVTTFAVDGAVNTDGIDVTNVSMGSTFPLGMFAAHSGSRAIRLCDYADIGINVDTEYWNPRNLTDPPLPVQLSTFAVKERGGKIVLEWRTESEINNVGFEILRSFSEAGDYAMVASYEYEPSLKGLGSSSVGKEYSYTDDRVVEGLVHWYKLVDVDINRVRTEHGPVSVDTERRNGSIYNLTSSVLPKRFQLFPNFPNPFNPVTHIQFDVPLTNQEFQNVMMNVYDIQGSKVKTLFSGLLPAGKYETQWEGRDWGGKITSSGVYVYMLESGSFRQAGKMILIH